MCSGTFKTDKKKTSIFILQQYLDPIPNFFRILPNSSDSTKIFGFFRIRIHNTEKHNCHIKQQKRILELKI
jgi:hypothetical protein